MFTPKYTAVGSALLLVLGVIVLIGCDDEGAPGTTVQGAEPSTLPAATPAPPNPLARDAAPRNPLAKDSQSLPVDRQSQTPPFHGTWNTSVQGTQSVLRLEQSDRALSGRIDLALISGTVDGDAARGEVKDPDTKQVGGTFVITRKGEDLEFKLTLRDPDSGQTLALPAIVYKPGEPAAADTSLDRQVVGRWRNTETYVSGDFSSATDTWLILNADGTYEYGHGKSGAGGAAGSVVSGRGDATVGKWRTNDRNLQYRENGGAWQTFGRYYVEGDSMMITYPNGSKKIWYRR